MKRAIRFCRITLAALSVLAVLPQPARAESIAPAFASDYTLVNLGAVPGLPPAYGGLTFKLGDPNTILIGGNANEDVGRLYEIGVVRGAGNHITGFTGSATLVGGVGTFNDGGVVYGPGGVLFTAQWPVNKLGQTKPGNTVEDKVIDMTALNVDVTQNESLSAFNFVPAGFGDAGKMKLVTWEAGKFFTATLAADGSGTFDLTNIVREDLDTSTAAIDDLPGGPEGFVYISGGNPGFLANALLVSEFSAGNVAAYDLDALSNPILGSRRDFVTGLEGAEGAIIDPLTGDFLFSTFGTAQDHVILVQGFTQPPPPLPEPASLALIATALAGLAMFRRRAAVVKS